ncbi:PLP-dependent transferase [Marinihelvus fidelis]|uniref:PLP-dependent transferase n=1 Tax=Marinihelvus fidelis TaxID=2613842 RepID=A0A5N0TGB6_9GAMM|nr:PLP-dependent aspartate aminotransferase family protein [Marinihelvus fidelis]KAA9133518.1 PLP-dependent transferase [Marinihelvus fidelis]
MSGAGKLKPSSLVVSAGRPRDRGQALNAPLVPASNFILGDEPVYSREDGTATWAAFEDAVGALEHGRAISFSSGMAAVAAVFEQVPAGGRVVLPDDCYQGVVRLALEGEQKARWRVTRLPTEDTPAWVAAAGEADLLWLETPSNPQLILADLDAIAAVPRRQGALLAVDNTFATPLNQRPLERGADISLHSATKYLGGHSDLLAGVVAVGDDELYGRLFAARQCNGATPGTLEAWLSLRGMRTLAVRLERAQANAARIAAFLEGHPDVVDTRYPGLESHPQHELARRQLDGYGAIVSFVLADATAADRLCESVRLIHHATSLGSVESTLERRGVHAGQGHLPPGLIRLSVGIEDADDLCADLAQALSTT